MQMKVLMRKYLYSLTIIAVTSLFSQSLYASNNITAKIVGEELVWLNANEINGENGEVQQQIWQPASTLNLFPVYEWTPTFQKSPLTSITFNSGSGKQVTANFQHSGVQFSTGSPFTEQGNSVSDTCSYQYSSNNQFILRGSSTCRANFDLKATAKYKPFDFYRSSFKMDNLVDAFKTAKAPAGIYYAAISLPLTYYMKYDTATSYQTYNTTTVFTIDYTPSFFDAVTILGDGKFSLDYDTSDNSVSGRTTYQISMSGELEPGITMQFESDGDKNKFELIRRAGSSDTIPYSLLCTRCDKQNVVEAGSLKQKISKISNPGKAVDFELVFSFENLKHGTVDEGEYQDNVTVRFGLGL